MARLLIIRGAELGIEYELDDVTRIGRSSKSTIQLLDPSVSRHHARIVRKGKDFHIENLSGTTDVLIGNVPVQGSTRLSDNDEIGIGRYGFVFNPELTMVRARYGDQILVISPHRPEELDLGEKKKQREGILREKSLRTLGAIYEHCLYIDDITQCLGKVLEEVMELFSTERGFVVLLRGAHVDLVATAGDSKRMIVSRTVIESLKKTGQAIISRDACSDVQFRQGLSIIEGKLRTIIAVPILDDKKVLGFLQVDSSKPSAKIGQDAHALMGKIARCLGSAVRRSFETRISKTAPEPSADFVATSKVMKTLIKNIDKAARAGSTCVIYGETGTGKEVTARMIHERSARKDGPFIAVNCAAIPETIIESELFGFEKGSFTGAYKTTAGKIELADGGTLFLDEIGDMSLYAQAKLLRFLQERVFYRIGAKRYIKVDLRILAATNKDLMEQVKEDKFRLDLYYRLAVIPLVVPPLRERKDDIPVMIERFVDHFCRELKRPPITLSAGMMERLVSYAWPGNVRELRNMMERFAVLGHEPDSSEAGMLLEPGKVSRTGEETTVDQSEKAAIIDALKKNRGKKSKAAADLGISRPTLDKKIRKYGIDIFL